MDTVAGQRKCPVQRGFLISGAHLKAHLGLFYKVFLSHSQRSGPEWRGPTVVYQELMSDDILKLCVCLLYIDSYGIKCSTVWEVFTWGQPK